MKHFDEYRNILKNELAKRFNNNQSYSQRAFARSLDLSRTQLNEVIAGRRGLSKSTATKISEKLGFTKDEKNYFIDLVLASHSRSKLVKEEAIKRIKLKNEINQNLDSDVLAIISDWYHFAILELTYIKDFEFSLQNTSTKLKISKFEAELAIGRLLKTGLLKIENGKYFASEDITFSTDGIPSEALKKAHHQFLQKACSALVTQNIEERNFNSSILAIDTSRINEAKEMINEFKNKFINEFGINKSDKKNAVYALTTQFFSLEK